MKDLKHISSGNKERLTKLVNKTANYVNTGLSPTDALVKAASEDDYPPQYVLRAAEAYNGAAHLAYFKSASLEERGDSFPLADGETALARVLGSADVSSKVAEQPRLSYLAEQDSYFDNKVSDDSFLFASKQASAPSFLEMQKAASALDKQERLTVESTRNRYNEACESLARGIKCFRDKTSSVSSHRRTHWAREMLEKHGSEALDVISLATGITGAECTKLASDKLGFFSLGDEELDSLDSLVRGFNQVRFLHDKAAQAEHDCYVNGLERRMLLDHAAGVKRSENFGINSTVSDLTGLVEPGLDTPGDSLQRGVLESLADPDFVDQSSRIDKALRLHKLMKNDPIIASKSPEELQQALSEISSIAPMATKSEPLLRSMLRRRLEAGEQIDDFSLNQMLNMEEKMRDQYKEYAVVPRLSGLSDLDKKGR